MVCASVAQPLPGAQLALQTNMEKHHPIFDLHNKVYGEKKQGLIPKCDWHLILDWQWNCFVYF